MFDIETHHKPGLEHHVHQGMAWLSMSEEGECTAALSYAALELRFAVERLAVQYWAILLDREPNEEDLKDIRSFKNVEGRIYALAGHQRAIDGHFDFIRIVVDALKVDLPLRTPKIGTLSKYWHTCSDLCHIAAPLSSSVPEIRKAWFASLTEIAESLLDQVRSLGWPVLREAGFAALRTEFVAGHATAEDVRLHLQRIGVWARVEFQDGRQPCFVGQAIPPIGSGS